MNKKNFSAIIWLTILSISSFAQESITLKDAAQMKYLAQNIVKSDLKDLLNAIANKDFTTNDITTIKKNSYTSGNRSQIFFDKTGTIIEDDVDPNNKSKSNEHNSTVEKYLEDFDILYKKSNSQSIIFSNISVSNPKKGNGNYIFVKVYYNSFFRNLNNEDKEYTINNRVAQVRMERQDKNWAPKIDLIAFFSPEDTLNDFADDLHFQGYDSIANSSFTGQAELEIASDAVKGFEKEQKALRDKFNDLIAKGDKAKGASDFTTALQYYTEAKELFPKDPLPVSRIIEVSKLKTVSELTNEQNYKNFVKKAKDEELKRNYQAASGYYKKANGVMPEKASENEKKIKELDSKWQIVSELQEKFEAEVDSKVLINEYDKVIKKNKTNSDLYVGRGKCYDRINNLPKALKDYNYAFELDNYNYPALKLRAALKTKQNDNFSALTDYKTYLGGSAEDWEIYELMSDLRLRIKPDNFDGAIKDLDDGIDKNKERWSFYYKKGLLLAQKNDLKGAIKNFTTALFYDSSKALSYFHRGKNFLALNHIENAALDFEAARRNGLDSQNIYNVGGYAQVFANRAAQKFTSGSLDSAITLIDYAISINPANSEYRYSRGNYFLSKANNHEAIKSFDQAVELKNNFTEAYYKRGLAYYNLADYNTAAKNFKKTLELDIKHFDAQKGLGDSYFALKDYKNAAQTYETFIKTVTTPKTNLSTPLTIAEVYNSLGKSYFLSSESDERALEAYKDAIKKNPVYAEAYYNKGLYYHKKIALSDAIKDMEKAISLDSKHPIVWNYQLAQAYQDKGDFQNAASNYKATITADSMKNYPKALYLLANSNYQIPDYASALPNYQKVKSLGLDSGINTFNYELGIIFLNLNKPDSAFEYLNKAYLKDSTNGNVLYGIATSHQLKGKTDDALLWFDKAFQTKQINKKQVTNDKLIASLKEDKRFKALMKKSF